MQAKYKVALALLSGISLGAGASHGLRAAASPPAYVINEINVKDEDGYKNNFLPAAQKAIDDNGGKYIAGGFNKTFAITGKPPAERVVILQFENMERVAGYCARCAREHRQQICDLPHVRSGRRSAILNVPRSRPASASTLRKATRSTCREEGKEEWGAPLCQLTPDKVWRIERTTLWQSLHASATWPT